MEFFLINLKDESLELIIYKNNSQLEVIRNNISIKEILLNNVNQNIDLIIFSNEETLKEFHLNIDIQKLHLHYFILDTLFDKYKKLKNLNVNLEKNKDITFYLALFNHIKQELDFNSLEELIFKRWIKIFKIDDIILSNGGISSFDKNFLIDKRVLFTGGLTKMKRGEAMYLIRQIGAIPVSSFSKNIDILVCGNSKRGYEKSTKRRKTEALIEKGFEITILSEEEFFTIIDSKKKY